jgi:hypothetical protein
MILPTNSPLTPGALVRIGILFMPKLGYRDFIHAPMHNSWSLSDFEFFLVPSRMIFGQVLPENQL